MKPVSNMNRFPGVALNRMRRRGLTLCFGVLTALSTHAGTIADAPLFLTVSAPPLVLLTMARDHKLYYEAYNDASDLNDDGVLDIRYNPNIDYFGYFNSYTCYQYTSSRFEPSSATADKKCSGKWSGDFLNYLTTSRMDALRKVLYGGYRSTDSTSETVLERVYIPQDAHSWGKEYQSVAVDGYDISQYTPLAMPVASTRHLFANVTLLNTSNPLLRVLKDSTFRVWEWMSIERPVAGTDCATGNNQRSSCAHAAQNYNSNPADHAAFESMVATYGNASHQQGSGAPSNGQINGSGNPYGSSDYYLNIFRGNLNITTSGSYQFAVDGDDAVEVIIDGTVVVGWYGGHGNCGCYSHSGSITLGVGAHTVEFRHEEQTGGDSYYLWWKGPNSTNQAWEKVPASKFTGLIQTTYNVLSPASTMTDYTVRVKVCVAGMLETNCKAYKSGSTTTYKPTGLLHEHGENDSMMFGLLTGSYTKNTSGGVLRKNLLSFSSEVTPTTGQFVSGANGIVDTINKLKTTGFGGSYQYNQSCAVPEVNAPLAEGRCRMWGNPVGEMMYEGLRYFGGKAAPTTDFSISGSGDDSTLGLPLPTWLDPYSANMGTNYPTGYPTCSRPSQLVISDINPNYDTDKVPGSTFNGFSGDLSGLNVATQANTIWQGENEAPQVFIGQSGSTYDGAPTPKTITNFNNVRGLSPEEPSREGGYYSAAVALYGKTNDLSSASGSQQTDTFSVVLASPLPRIQIPVGGSQIELVPFGKTVGGCGSFSRTAGSYQPTNTIVDFYVDTIKNTAAGNQDASVNGGRPYGKFRINYEDSEYGSDHDMDAIVEYTLTVKADNTLDVVLNSNYAAGSCIQHMGYVISGTTADGTYLDVRDSDTTSDVDYFLDTPAGQGPGGTWSDNQALPLAATRNFSAGSTSAASHIKHDPLWYAAKWGGFFDRKDPATNLGNNQLDGDEWDRNHDDVPDSYFLVTNAGNLKAQLGAAFAEIKGRTGSAATMATNSTRVDTDVQVFQAKFNSADWSGQLISFPLDSNGRYIDADSNGVIDDADAIWDAANKIPSAATRKIYSYDPTRVGAKGIEFQWAQLNASQQTDLLSQDVLDYLRGDQSQEISAGPFRKREKLLGDIVNSDPAFVGPENYGYQTLPGEGATYADFVKTTKRQRTRMVYAGANDGMLHGFRVCVPTDGHCPGTVATDDGKELLAYVPDRVIHNTLASLSEDPYYHRYFVDGAAKAGDAFIGSAWRTVLLGSTGAGARSVFALDVTDPNGFDASKVLWEFTDTNDTDLGYTLPQSSIVRMYDGHWAALVANGYNSTDGKAVLFILNLQDGSVLRKIDTGAAGNSIVTKNGLSTPLAVDVSRDLDGDGDTDPADKIVDYVYAGDLVGNLWKFDVTSATASNWGIATGATPLFVACASATTPCSDANRQPITAKAQAIRASATGQDSGLMVLFGTGKYFEEGDNMVPADPQMQSIYGIWDHGPTIAGRGELQAQTIDAEATLGGYDLRVTSQNAVDYSTQKGWYMDLRTSTGVKQGERVVSPPWLDGKRIAFATMMPIEDPCSYGGTSWIMDVNALTGQQSNRPVWDVNGSTGSPDGKFDSYDKVTVNGGLTAASGVKSKIGILKPPAIVKSGGKKFWYFSGSAGGMDQFAKPTDEEGGRQTWIQLR